MFQKPKNSPPCPRKKIESLNLSAKRASEGFSLLFLGKTILLSIFFGYFLLYHSLGFPAGLSILLISFPLFSTILSKYREYLKIREISGFSRPDEFHTLFVEIERQRLFSKISLFLSGGLSLAFGHILFPQFISGYLDLFSVEASASAFLVFSLVFLGTFIVPAFARYSLATKTKGTGRHEELEETLGLVELKTRALSLFPAIYFLIFLLFLLGGDKKILVWLIAVSSLLMAGAIISFYLESELLIRKRLAKEGVLPAKDERIVATFFGITSLGTYPNFHLPFSTERENSLLLTNRRIVFLKIPGNKKTAPEIARVGKEIERKGLSELLKLGKNSLEYFEISRAELKGKGLELDIEAKDGRKYRHLLLDREDSGRLSAHLKTQISHKFTA